MVLAINELRTSLINEANARFGYINNCWAGSGLGKDMSWMEVITDLVLTIFLGLAVHTADTGAAHATPAQLTTRHGAFASGFCASLCRVLGWHFYIMDANDFLLRRSNAPACVESAFSKTAHTPS